MAWTAPSGHVWTTGEVVTAANMNTYIRLNLEDLGRRTVAVFDSVATSQTTTSTAYVSLGTVGPSVSVVGSTNLIVAVYAAISNSGANASYMVPSTTTIAGTDFPVDGDALSSVGTSVLRSGRVKFASLVGTTAVKVYYRVAAGTGTWADRALAVVPLAQS